MLNMRVSREYINAIVAAVVLVISIASLPATLSAQETTVRHYDIETVDVLADRPLRDIGVSKTTIDSLHLKRSISLSMADVLTFGSSIFVKSYGRATLSTVSFRGTSPSHTAVTWNGMKLNSPMLGMVDFSMIPSYFVDSAEILHGSSSVSHSAGALGGAILLGSAPTDVNGFKLSYTQGVGSFRTFDEYLRLLWGGKRWQLSTRISVASSPNDFKYTNRDKRLNIYDEDMNIVEQYYPEERNESGSYFDLNVLQEAWWHNDKGDKVSLGAWYAYSNRELPLLTTDYADDTKFDNRQQEHTLRAVASWSHRGTSYMLNLSGGYTHTTQNYDYKRDPGSGIMTTMTASESHVNTIYGKAEVEYYVGDKWHFSGSLTAHQHFVQSRDRAIRLQQGGTGIVGYNQARIELSAAATARYRPCDRVGMSLTLREELVGRELSPLVPAFMADVQISKRGNVVAKASVSRNYRYPTLNDLYFMPGGNPNLRSERGWTYDVGISSEGYLFEQVKLRGSATWFDSHISDWILWLPTTKGFFSPRNVKDVHSYGVEIKANVDVRLGRKWALRLDANYSYTPSINVGEPISAADRSVGKQLPYVPRHSASLTGVVAWRGWAFSYMWCHYSERYTMSSNDLSLTGRLPKYYMSNISLEKSLQLRWAELSFKGLVNNIFDEEYLSVLSRPMPGINFELFVGITPKW